MERKIGEVFQYEGKTYQVVESIRCDGCAFNRSAKCSTIREPLGSCDSIRRKDRINVVFKEINNMENNQLTIDIPKGMEIDLENSNLAKGIVKFKKKDITYENVEDALKLGKNCKNIIINESNASKLVTLSKLMNIAKYYNGDWKPDWSNTDEYKYYIIYSYKDNIYAIDYSYYYTYSTIYFKNRKDAIAVINNPNFRDILDAVYKN